MNQEQKGNITIAIAIIVWLIIISCLLYRL
jgi:hypothetical protein